MDVRSLIQKLLSGGADQKDIDALVNAIVLGNATLSGGARSAAIGGDANYAVINTGDTNIQMTPEAIISLTSKPYKPLPIEDLSALPESGNPPPGSRIGFLQNKIFTGREQALIDLAKGLFGGSTTLVTQSITGIGGVGKTQLAVEFCYRYGRFFQGVHWIDAALTEQEEQTNENFKSKLLTEIALNGDYMHLPVWPSDLTEQVRHTLAVWSQGKPRLIVVDNVESVEQAKAILSELNQIGNLRIFLTSRRQSWPQALIGLTYLLDVFSQDESLVFLRKYLTDEKNYTDENLIALAEKLGRLPLALELAGRYIYRSRASISSYLTELDEILAHPSMENWKPDDGSSPTGHDRSLRSTFLLSWRSVTNERSQILFRLMSWCAPNENIPRSLIQAASELDSESTNAGLLELEDVGLIKFELGSELMLHPLIAEFGRMESKTSHAGADLEKIADAVAKSCYEANETGLPSSFYPLRPHVEMLIGHSEKEKLSITATLIVNLSYHEDAIANLVAAKIGYERALKIFETAYGPDHSNVAICVNNLGGVFKALGDLPAARAAYERALKIDEAAYGPDHPKVAIRVNNLGGVFEALGDLPPARAAYERALKIDEAAYGPDHPKVAIHVNNLGGVFEALGDLPAARAAYERALKIDEAAYGPDHPKVAIRVNNLGGVFKALGDLPAARAAYERALKIDEAAYGPDHPNVATGVNNLGGVFKALGDLPAARAAYERALKIFEAAYGPDHPNVATGVNNLGGVFKALGDLPAARAAYERALSILEKSLPPNHTSIKTVKANLLALD